MSKRIRKKWSISTFCGIILDSKDMIKIILGFLAIDKLKHQIPFTDPVLGACAHIEEAMQPNDTDDLNYTVTPSHTFSVLPVSLKRINKIFYECVNELSHLVVSVETSINLRKLSSFPNCRYLKQLYLIYDLSQGSDDEVVAKIQNLQNLNFPCLKVLQLHYFNDHLAMEPASVDINLSMENLPVLDTLILGNIYNDERKRMRIDNIYLDLDIDELRIQHCSINNLDSLRFSLAKCCLIDTLFLILTPFDDKQAKNYSLHSLCLLHAGIVFIQIECLSSITMYAPELQVIQFFFCDILDKLILLDRIPNTLRSHVDPNPDFVTKINEDNINKMLTHKLSSLDIGNNGGQSSMEQDDEEDDDDDDNDRLMVGFDNCYEDLIERHLDKFTVVRNAKKYNDECDIRFTCAVRRMWVWPYAYFR